jgi:glycosyltransferase involved in cell wall biosynthesis
MKEHSNHPDFLFEVSWEVCNLVGGIYAVLSTKAATLQAAIGDGLCFIGPDFWNPKKKQESPFFDATAQTSLEEWAKKAREEGLPVRVGRWKVQGQPQVILVDFKKYFSEKNELYTRMWEWYGVESLQAYGDYDESCIFAYASALVIQHLYMHFCPQRSHTVAHFDEWTTGMGLLWLKHQCPAIATVFTTHATSIGRSIAGNNKPLYDYLHGYFGDQMAQELNMVSKHSVEKHAAQQADCFTTVSEITARECAQLLGRRPLVTPNGYELGFVPRSVELMRKRRATREQLGQLVQTLTGEAVAEDALFVGTSGRCEYKNKGIDVFLDVMDRVRAMGHERQVVAFVMVPGWVDAPRQDLVNALRSKKPQEGPLSDPIITHTLHDYGCDPIYNRLHQLGFDNRPGTKVKVIYVPSYLKGDDGILNQPYFECLAAMDMTLFPSYYEPWGYTPMESCAFHVPTVTTSLSGFGMWCRQQGKDQDLLDGVSVVERNDGNYLEVVAHAAEQVERLLLMPPAEMKLVRHEAHKAVSRADWAHFIRYYYQAYESAIRVMQQRVKAGAR